MALKTFSVAKITEALEFKFDAEGDDFVFTAYAPQEVPANVLVEYSELVQEGKLHEAHKRFFRRALHDDSAKEFEKRLDSNDKPITLASLIEVAEWLVTEYSRFPTKSAKRS